MCLEHSHTFCYLGVPLQVPRVPSARGYSYPRHRLSKIIRDEREGFQIIHVSPVEFPQETVQSCSVWKALQPTCELDSGRHTLTLAGDIVSSGLCNLRNTVTNTYPLNGSNDRAPISTPDSMMISKRDLNSAESGLRPPSWVNTISNSTRLLYMVSEGPAKGRYNLQITPSGLAHPSRLRKHAPAQFPDVFDGKGWRDDVS